MRNSQSSRKPLDFYPTPQPLCDAVVAWLDKTILPRAILEPSGGSGNFVRSARNAWPSAFIQAIDLNPEARSLCIAAGAHSFLEGDMTTIQMDPTADGFDLDLILGNPPYNAAEEHIRHALTLLAPGGLLAFVLRINFLGALKRLPFWREFPALYMVPIVPRPDFSGEGGDSTEYALYVWQRDHCGSSILKPHLTWEKPSRRKAKAA